MGARLAFVFAALLGGAPRPPPPPPTPLVVQAEGSITAGTVRGKERVRYGLVLPVKGTAIVSLLSVQGPTPKARLLNAEGKAIRRDRNAQLWTRSPPGEPLTLELTARDPAVPSTFLVRVVLDVDRPRPERDAPRPARPLDVVSVPSHGRSVERVLVDDILAEHVERRGGFLVTIPAYARSGVIELHHESGAHDTVTLALIGAEPPTPDVRTDACAAPDGGTQPGCLRVLLTPAVGSVWLAEIARLIDADIAAHTQKTGEVLFKLRIASSESWALTTLRALPGVRDAQR